MTSCEGCGFRFRQEDSSSIHNHHVRPKQHGGDDTIFNMVALCPNCHTIAHIVLRAAMRNREDIYRLYDKNQLLMDIDKYRESVNPKPEELDIETKNRIEIILKTGLFNNEEDIIAFIKRKVEEEKRQRRYEEPQKVLRAKHIHKYK